MGQQVVMRLGISPFSASAAYSSLTAVAPMAVSSIPAKPRRFMAEDREAKVAPSGSAAMKDGATEA